MASAGRRGRPQRPYRTSWGEDIPGLYRCPDGRWREIATDRKFTEPDERRAVARFLAAHRPHTVPVPSALVIEAPVDSEGFASGMVVRAETPSEAYWPWLREQVIARPEYIAKMIGIPELAQLRHLPLPKPAIRFEVLIEAYERKNPAAAGSKRAAVRVLRRLLDHSGATTLEDLTQESLLQFRAEIERDVPAASTRVFYYGRIKVILGFGLKLGMDQIQIRAALDRCKVLWTGDPLPPVKPMPMSREHFHALLGTANGAWRSWLLLGLNLAMYLEDLCELRWADFDLAKGTYAAIRKKTRRDRIPRAATLWPETVEALNRLGRKSEYIFTSRHGTRYSGNARHNEFAELRRGASLPEQVKFSHLRDGAYTAACQGTADERWARVLAGHRAAGLQDNYVLRNPEAVRPACEAVYAAYGPFPAPPAPRDATSNKS